MAYSIEIMMRAAVLSLAAALTGLAADPAWVRLRSTNFELFTTAGEKKGREAILHFEQVRSFFLSATGARQHTPLPVRIVAFRSENEFRPYSFNPFISAFYVGTHDRDYIVLRNLSWVSYPAAVHEYTHLMIRHSGMEVPVWLNEGLAELYSTLRPMGRQVQIGELIPGRLQVLQEKKWLELDELLAVGRDSPHYNERDRLGVFYAQSWALTHMLRLSEEYRDRFSEFLKMLLGRDAGAALQQVYGKSTADVMKDLQKYVRGNRFFVMTFPIKLEKSAEQPVVEAASAVESGLVLVNLLALSGKRAEAKAAYEKLAQEHPHNAEVAEEQAYFASHAGQAEEAGRHFARAVELGSSKPKLYFDYAMYGAASETERLDLLRKAVELKPDFEEAHFQLGLRLVNAHHFEEAVKHLRQVKRVTSEQAPMFFQALAYADYRIGEKEQARVAAKRAREFAKTPEEIARIEQLLRYIEEQAAGPPPATESARGPEAPPSLSRRPLPPPVEEAAEPVEERLPSVEGELEHVDCRGTVAVLRIRSEGKSVALAIVDAASVVVKGVEPAVVDFACGPQKPRRLVVEYEAKADSRLGTMGVVRGIEFK